MEREALLTKKSSSSSSNHSYQSVTQQDGKLKEDSIYFENDESFVWTLKEEQEVLGILDRKLMMFILIMSFVLNMDRTNLSNAISDNLAIDLGFTNDGVNTGIAVYHFVFTICTLPSNMISSKVGAHRWIPILMNSWAVVTWAHALIYDFKGFMVVRVLVAVTESGFIPACLSYMSQWYKTNELATRLAWFWGSQAIASAVSGLISFGVFRMRGTLGLEGWKWLFIVDGLATHVIGLIAFFYLPSSPASTHGGLRGSMGCLTKRQIRIAELRITRDDETKKEHNKPITRSDVTSALVDTHLWTHLLITFFGLMSSVPLGSYLPFIIKNAGFSTTSANILTAPSFLIGLGLSIFIAQSSDKHGGGQVVYFALIGSVWTLVGFMILEYLPDDAGRFQIYAAALFTASAPSWHGMQIAWMSSNVAPIGKRALALAAVIGAANINGVPGSYIYKADDAPRFRHGNKINIVIQVVTIALFLFQRTRYKLTNTWRRRIWNTMSDTEKMKYVKENEGKGSNRLDFIYRL